MTLKIKIEHAMPGYQMAAQVEAVTVTGDGTFTKTKYSPTAILLPGESTEMYVHSSQQILVTEIPLP
jgi:hypothetical protein